MAYSFLVYQLSATAAAGFFLITHQCLRLFKIPCEKIQEQQHDQQEEQPTIYTARRVITQSGSDPQAGAETQGFAVWRGRVLATGSPAALRERHPAAELVDFGAATVVPGFHDAHLHLASAADQLLQVDLYYPNVQSQAAVLRRLRDRAGRAAL